MGRIRGDLLERTLSFGVAVLRSVATLPNDARGREVARQLIRCGTSIGANIREADNALTDPEFTNKISIARKEAAETVYWLDPIARAELTDGKLAASMREEAEQLARVLGTIVARMHERESKIGTKADKRADIKRDNGQQGR